MMASSNIRDALSMSASLIRALSSERSGNGGPKTVYEDDLRNFINDIKLMRAAIINAVEGSQNSWCGNVCEDVWGCCRCCRCVKTCQDYHR